MKHAPWSLLLLLACGAPDEADLADTRGGRVDAYFNEPGTNLSNLWEPDAIDMMVETIDKAKVSIDLAVMGFTREELIDAFIRAYDRGVAVRMVGDGGHLTNEGYERFRERHIPMVVGNTQHIMHNKFMVADGRFVVASTANWSDTDLRHNNNNFVAIDHAGVAADFSAEFQQMFDGRFGHTKIPINNGRVYTAGDTQVEVWFAPQEDPMGRILELVNGVESTLRFTIFAFTKDQLGSAMVAKHVELNGDLDAAGLAALMADPLAHDGVTGVIDQSQLHSNGQYHEVYRLLGAGIPLRMDGNDNGQQPGDYQAGGGRQHAKTLILDADGAEPIVITGSFNWSASATQSNDEFLMVLHGGRVARAYDEWYRTVWGQGRRFGVERVADGQVKPGDVVISELMWYGVTPEDAEGLDDYLELHNRTDRTLRLDLWQLRGPNDFALGFPPGTVLLPDQHYLVVDHVLEAYQDGTPQDESSAYVEADMVVNPFNDDRQARLFLKDGNLSLRLLDPDGVQVDAVGNGGPAFFGGPLEDGRVRSMERRSDPGDGTLAASWYACTLEASEFPVREDLRETLLGTPGGANSAEP